MTEPQNGSDSPEVPAPNPPEPSSLESIEALPVEPPRPLEPERPRPSPPPEIQYLDEVPPSRTRPPTSPAPARAHAPSPRPQTPPPSKLEILFPLPNAMVGRPYDATVLLTVGKGLPREVKPSEISVISRQVDGLEPLGLKAEPVGDKIRVFGEPKEAGDHLVSLSFTILIRGRNWITSTESFNLTINPDPRSLWKNLEPPESAPFQRPHAQSERLVAGDSIVIAASRRGRSHANTGSHRDDAFELGHVSESGWSILAVADGAGSAPLSRRGAEIACRTAVEEIRPHLKTTLDGAFSALLARLAADRTQDDRAIRNALYLSLGAVGKNAYLRITEEAGKLGRPTEEFATTLLFTIVRKFDFGWFLATIGVGDGGVGIYRKDSGVTLLSKPDSGDYAGQTRFLTMPRIWADGNEILGRIYFEIVPDFTALVAMTDGVTDPKFASEKALGDSDCWDGFWADLTGSVGLTKDNASSDQELLEWLNFWSVGNHDDRTIAIFLP